MEAVANQEKRRGHAAPREPHQKGRIASSRGWISRVLCACRGWHAWSVRCPAAAVLLLCNRSAARKVRGKGREGKGKGQRRPTYAHAREEERGSRSGSRLRRCVCWPFDPLPPQWRALLPLRAPLKRTRFRADGRLRREGRRGRRREREREREEMRVPWTMRAALPLPLCTCFVPLPVHPSPL